MNETSNYSVCTTWLVDRKTYYLVDVWRGKLEFPKLRTMVATQARNHDAQTVLIEKAGVGEQLVQQLKYDQTPGIPAPVGIKPEGDKLTRMEGQSSAFEAGQVLLPQYAPWLAEYLNELLGFPNASNDDQVDSTSQFLNWIGRQREPAPIMVPGTLFIFDEDGNTYDQDGHPLDEDGNRIDYQ